MVRPLDIHVRRGDAEFEPVTDLWSGELDTRNSAFAQYLSDLSEAARGGEIALRFPPHKTPQVSEPGAWNLVGDVAFSREYPLSWNYLDPRSPNYDLKQFSKHLYLHRMRRWFEEVPAGAPVLDLGGGIGRFAQLWLERGHAVTLADPNESALVIALGHLARTGGRFDLCHLAAEDLAPLADESFWAVTAMEVFCYLSDAAEGIAEAARVLRPGGVLMCSVESPVGTLNPAQSHSREEIEAVMGTTELRVDGDMWVKYFTSDGLRAAMESAGLEVELVFGTHYLPDGPMHALVDFDRLSDPNYEQALLQLETLLEGSDRWHNAARAWAAVARKPGR